MQQESNKYHQFYVVFVKTIMFMKKINYFFISFVFISSTFVLQSCKDEKNTIEAIAETPKETAIEVLQDIEKIQYAEPVYALENSEFCKRRIHSESSSKNEN